MSLIFRHLSLTRALKWRTGGVFESRRGTVSFLEETLRIVLIGGSERHQVFFMDLE